mmetsp:Transcript_29409/g.33784  ORF Transcript_29409/g.33784 Transcript_29409/m.33784 type:complete len:1278 (+) Transcript_29409:118-3951(+)
MMRRLPTPHENEKDSKPLINKTNTEFPLPSTTLTSSSNTSRTTKVNMSASQAPTSTSTSLSTNIGTASQPIQTPMRTPMHWRAKCTNDEQSQSQSQSQSQPSVQAQAQAQVHQTSQPQPNSSIRDTNLHKEERSYSSISVTKSVQTQTQTQIQTEAEAEVGLQDANENSALISTPISNQEHKFLPYQNINIAPDSNGSTSSPMSSPPGTPFRFTSFPASLPRVNPKAATPMVGGHYSHSHSNVMNTNTNTNCGTNEYYQNATALTSSQTRNNNVLNYCPSSTGIAAGKSSHHTVRKRMISAEQEFSNANENHHADRRHGHRQEGHIHGQGHIHGHRQGHGQIQAPVHTQTNQNQQHQQPTTSSSFIDKESDYLDISRDESLNTHNTSLSSLSVDGAVTNTNTRKAIFGLHNPPGTRLKDPPVSLPSQFDVHHSHSYSVPSTGRAVWLSPVLRESKINVAGHYPYSPTLTKSFVEDGEEEDDHDDDDDGGEHDENGDANTHTHTHTHLNCLHDDTNDVISNHDAAGNNIVVRTRLNFGTIFTPSPGEVVAKFRQTNSHLEDSQEDVGKNFTPARNILNCSQQTSSAPSSQINQNDLSQSYVQVRTYSLPSVSTMGEETSVVGSVVSTPYQARPTNSGRVVLEEEGNASSNSCEILAGNGNNLTPQGNNLTPQELNFRVRLDSTQCSPIASVPEDLEVAERVVVSSVIINDHSDEHGHGHGHDKKVDSPTSSNGHMSTDSRQASLMSGSSQSSKTRKLRPMPDMSAFDMGSATTVSSYQNTDSLDRGNQSGTAPRIHHSPVKLLCPPTPVRTPAWAHHGSFAPSNSLITTKVLAACPPQTFEALSSIEDSLTDDDKNMSQATHNDFEATSKTPFKTNVATTQKTTKSKGTGRSTGTSGTSGSEFEDVDLTVSLDSDFENLGRLGSGAFADVFKVRWNTDHNLYAIKRTRRQFRGKKDRDRAMKEIRIMQLLQSQEKNNAYSMYVLKFTQAWQEDGHLLSQTELCCRDTCQQMMVSVTSNFDTTSKLFPSLLNHLKEGRDISQRLVPENTLWKICHDVAAGLHHIHSHDIVHNDIKPMNIFFVSHLQLGAVCKIGDFGLAGFKGTVDDGQEGDTMYMPQEILAGSAKHPSGDIFSLGITLYELSSSDSWILPSEGAKWHDIRSGFHCPQIPESRSNVLLKLIQSMINPTYEERPTASQILTKDEVLAAGKKVDLFLTNYVRDVDAFDRAREREAAEAQHKANQRYTPTPLQNRDIDSERCWNVRTPTPFSNGNISHQANR